MPLQNIVIGQKVSSTMWQTARDLRRKMTPEEKILWQQLRANRLDGFHFRRQQIIGKYVVDLYCHAAMLVVELDGGIHDEQVEHDEYRAGELESLGLLILRFKNEEIHNNNEEIHNNLANVLLRLAEACRARANLSPCLLS